MKRTFLHRVLRVFVKEQNLKWIPDGLYLRFRYFVLMKKVLRLRKPVTFNEKLQWLKLHDRRPIYTTMVDKCEAKKFVAERIGEQYIIKTLGVWNTFDEIDFDQLPNQFVLKCTHDSGGLVIVNDKSKLDIEQARNKIEKCLKINYFWNGREWPYKNVKPRIIAEDYIAVEGEDLRDYKFFCFNGKVECFKIDFDRFIEHRANYYTPQGEMLPFGEAVCPPDFDRNIEMPSNLDLMIELAKKLSVDTSFVRVDFYNVRGNIYFGELTFFPGSGAGPFIPSIWDEKLGDLLQLPK